MKDYGLNRQPKNLLSLPAVLIPVAFVACYLPSLSLLPAVISTGSIVFTQLEMYLTSSGPGLIILFCLQIGDLALRNKTHLYSREHLVEKRSSIQAGPNLYASNSKLIWDKSSRTSYYPIIEQCGERAASGRDGYGTSSVPTSLSRIIFKAEQYGG